MRHGLDGRVERPGRSWPQGHRPRGNEVGRGPAAGLAAAVQSAEGRVLDAGLVLPRQGQLDETEKVLEYLGVTLYACPPVLVEAALEDLLGVG